MDLRHLNDLAISAAISAGKVIQQYLDKDISIRKKQGGTSYASQVVTEVDKASEAAILTHLIPSCESYNLALISEETEDDGSRFNKDFFWCIDPMDGTLAFINKRPGFSVSIALVAKNGIPHIGVVYDPSTDTLYSAIKGMGAFRNAEPWHIQPNNDFLTYVTDHPLKDTRRATEIEEILNDQVKKLGLDGVKEIAGSGAVLNALLVLENNPACMMKFPKKEKGCGSIWDYAATACIYNELGLTATNFSGGTLDLNKRIGSFMNHEGVFFSTDFEIKRHSI